MGYVTILLKLFCCPSHQVSQTNDAFRGASIVISKYGSPHGL